MGNTEGSNAGNFQMVVKSAINLPGVQIKGTIYPIVERVAQILGVKMTKEVFAKGIGKVVPFLGGFVSGALTFATFKPMSWRLKEHLEKLPTT